MDDEILTPPNGDIVFDQPTPQRINGFAPGDRVAVVSGVMAGAYGKVEFSSGGCDPKHCVKECRLVWVELMTRPEGVDTFVHNTYSDNGNMFRFMVSEVTHVD